MNLTQLAPDEPLSPELVLILSPELRVQALARLGPPVWPAPRPRTTHAPAPARPSFRRSLAVALVARVGQLGLVFAVVTIATLAMSIVAHAVR
jgi:hypothetical protein